MPPAFRGNVVTVSLEALVLAPDEQNPAVRPFHVHGCPVDVIALPGGVCAGRLRSSLTIVRFGLAAVVVGRPAGPFGALGRYVATNGRLKWGSHLFFPRLSLLRL
jgi:hypothetical protein